MNELSKAISGTVSVLFGANWCTPCNKVKDLIERETEGEGVGYMDVNNMSETERGGVGIVSIPRVVKWREGVEVYSGYVTERNYKVLLELGG